jgi:hypothetical protein
LREVGHIAEQLAQKAFDQLRQCLEFVAIGSSEINSEEFSYIIDHQMQFETKTPTGRTFAAGSHPFEDFVLRDAAIVTDGDEGRVHKASPTALPQATEQIPTQPTQQSWHSLHKASIADELWEFTLQIDCHLFLVVGFECPILALLKMDHDRQGLAVAQVPGSLSSLVPITQQPSNSLQLHRLAEIIDSTLQFQ